MVGTDRLVDALALDFVGRLRALSARPVGPCPPIGPPVSACSPPPVELDEIVDGIVGQLVDVGVPEGVDGDP